MSFKNIKIVSFFFCNKNIIINLSIYFCVFECMLLYYYDHERDVINHFIYNLKYVHNMYMYDSCAMCYGEGSAI